MMRRRRYKTRRRITLFVIFLISLFLGWKGLSGYWQSSEIISPLTDRVYEFITGKSSDRLGGVVLEQLVGTTGSYSVVVKDVDTDEITYFNEHKQYKAGSLYKLWVLAAAYKKIEEGSLKEDEVLSADIVDLNKDFNIASEEAELVDGDLEMTVGQALSQMITISHNYAALMLVKRIGLSTVIIYLEKNGFSESHLGAEGEAPMTSASDIALFYEKLLDGKLGSAENTQKMLALLKQQTLNDKLPKYLPKDVMVAHKTGELGRISHDAGIVFLKKSRYVIIVLSDTDFPPGAEERIAKISEGVYKYLRTK